jgi:hypothetical protein
MKKLLFVLGMLWMAGLACGAHWISGFAEDALDGEGVDGKTVLMWNPSVGTADNLTDIIGAGGNSRVSGVYLMDCELLSAGCDVGDILSLKIIGDPYLSWVVNVTITGAGYDVVSNLTLNSPPNATLVSPEDSGYSPSDADFNCSFFDYDDNVESVSLWGNWSGWGQKDSVSSGLDDGYVIFSDTLIQGYYDWNCYVLDSLGVGSFASSNNTFFVDTTDPMISNVSSVDEVCGFGAIPVDCEVTDNVDVGYVVIRATAPNSSTFEYNASFVSDDIYRANAVVDDAGYWEFECFAYDVVGNSDWMQGEDVYVGSLNPEISFSGGVNFNATPSVEGEVINLTVNVTNFGCVGSGNFIVGFFDDGVNFANETAFVGVDMYEDVSTDWIVNIGTSNITVFADLEDVLDEDNESNNVVNGTAYMEAWQKIYGNVSLDLILGFANDTIGSWDKGSPFAGNVFVTDAEANIEWSSLQAIGRDKNGGLSSLDFGEIDFLLGMGSYNDSVSSIYSSSEIGTFNVFDNDIENVSYVNSSSNGNFITGILWDTSDSVDLEYDSSEGEDIIFAAKVNIGDVGTYGVYDYEIRAPSKLREYDATDSEKVYLYYDLE